MEFNKPRGTRDFLFDEVKARRDVEVVLREVFENYAYHEIKTPLFENLDLFTTKSGEQIVNQLYNFEDKSGRELALRPEITAPVARLYLNEMQRSLKPVKLYYYGSCFRYERPQAGRFRQFWQFGCELLGAKSPEAEAEVIALLVSSLNKLGLDTKKTAEIHIGHLGIVKNLFAEFEVSNDNQEQIMILIDKQDEEGLINYLDSLNNNSSEKIDTKLKEILLKIIHLIGDESVLDELESIIAGYDSTINALNEFRSLINMINAFDVDSSDYTINLGIARGLDYYTGMVFEVYIPELGAQKQICGGGSYNLIKSFGGEDISSTGFAFGFDRLINAIEATTKNKEAIYSKADVFVVPISDDTRAESYKIAQTLRNANISCEIDLYKRKFKKVLSYANSLNVKKAILVGKRDLDEGNVTIKDMATGEQAVVAINNILDNLNL